MSGWTDECAIKLSAFIHTCEKRNCLSSADAYFNQAFCIFPAKKKLCPLNFYIKTSLGMTFKRDKIKEVAIPNPMTQVTYNFECPFAYLQIGNQFILASHV